jgi:hypothetical protein
MEYATKSLKRIGGLAELVDAYALGAYDFGHESSSLLSPTLKNVDKSVYSVVYDKSTSSTIAKMESVVYKEKQIGGSLRNQYFRM